MERRITQDDVIYFIVTDRFFGRNKRNADPSDLSIHGGTLDGVIDKLDYLLELGVTAIWVTPVYENIDRFGDSEPYHYYWPRSFERMDARLLDGTRLPDSTNMSTFGAFVDACEQRGVKVVLDMIVNHTGYGAKGAFDASWFNVGGEGEIKGELAGLPDFNHDRPDVLDYFINNIEEWLVQGHVTNIRMDTVKHVEPKFWHYFKSQIRGQHPETRLIGEVLFEGKHEISKLLQYQNYHDFDSIFDFPLCTALRSTLVFDGSMREWLARPRLYQDEPTGVLDDDNPLKGGYRNANMLVTLLDNHDLQRRIMSHARTKHTGDGPGLDLGDPCDKAMPGRAVHDARHSTALLWHGDRAGRLESGRRPGPAPRLPVARDRRGPTSRPRVSQGARNLRVDARSDPPAQGERCAEVRRDGYAVVRRSGVCLSARGHGRRGAGGHQQRV